MNLAPHIAWTLVRINPLTADELKATQDILKLDVPHLRSTGNPTTWEVCDLAGRATGKAVKCTPNTARAVNAARIQRN